MAESATVQVAAASCQPQQTLQIDFYSRSTHSPSFVVVDIERNSQPLYFLLRDDARLSIYIMH